MKRLIPLSFAVIVTISIISTSCNSTSEEVEATKKIENTLQSVSYFKDTVGYDTQLLLEAFNIVNEAIDSIGYPDAGYKVWLIQEDSSEIRFMIEGFWPNQRVYDEIHNHPLYQKVWEEDDFDWGGLVSVEYHRFVRL